MRWLAALVLALRRRASESSRGDAGIRRRASESSRGDAGILVLAGGAAAVCAAVVLVGVLLDVSVARGRAQTAADAAALAAVTSAPLVGGDGDACAAAERLASLNGAVLEACDPPGGSRAMQAQVRVVITPAAAVLGRVLPDVRAEAAAALRPASETAWDRILPSPRSLDGVVPR